jgi:hypothetical protein
MLNKEANTLTTFKPIEGESIDNVQSNLVGDIGGRTLNQIRTLGQIRTSGFFGRRVRDNNNTNKTNELFVNIAAETTTNSSECARARD